MSRMTMEFQKLMDEMYGKSKAGSAAKEFGKSARTEPKKAKPIKRSPIRPSERTRAKNKTEAEVIAETRALVFELDPACVCGKCKPRPDDQMHEIDARSKTRGKAPEDRFNRRNCVRVSAKCHLLITGDLGKGKELRITRMSNELGADGGLMLTWKSTGEMVVYRRKNA